MNDDRKNPWNRIEKSALTPIFSALLHALRAKLAKNVEAAQIGDSPPFFFAARELLVGADEQALLDRCASNGAELIHPEPIPPQPPEVARTRHPGPQDAPRLVIVRLDP